MKKILNNTRSIIPPKEQLKTLIDYYNSERYDEAEKLAVSARAVLDSTIGERQYRDLKSLGNLVKANVTNSPWVPGIESLIKAKKDNQIFILVSAAPKQELQDICDSIGISKFFNRIYGSEVSKTKAISESISIFKMSHTDCVMIGDYKNDMVAARNNKISFILRSHEFNRNIKVSSNVRIIENFLM